MGQDLQATSRLTCRRTTTCLAARRCNPAATTSTTPTLLIAGPSASLKSRSGMSSRDYVLNKVLRPLGIDKTRLAQSDNMARWYTSDSANAEINAYYDQPIATVNPRPRLFQLVRALRRYAVTAGLR